MTPEVTYEVETPESIIYKRANVVVTLTGFHASLYRQMIWQYGSARAIDEFWWLWHKKEVSA